MQSQKHAQGVGQAPMSKPTAVRIKKTSDDNSKTITSSGDRAEIYISHASRVGGLTLRLFPELLVLVLQTGAVCLCVHIESVLFPRPEADAAKNNPRRQGPNM